MATTQQPSPVTVDTSRSPHAHLRPVPLNAVSLSDTFWQPRREINRTATLPSQFRHIEETARLDNFRRASGKKKDIAFEGIYFNDSDVYKWLEAAASTLATDNDPALADLIETAVTEVAAAQEPDGYLDTYFTFEKAGERWTNLKDMHELYCAGHLIQAAVVHHRATGSDSLLTVARRLADHIVATFGPEGRPGACGHEEVEMALVELYRDTGEQRYLEQAARFIDMRGREPGVIGGRSTEDRRYRQDHVPYRNLDEVTGHAVRMLYLTCGAADVFLENGDETLHTAMLRQWENMTGRRMYVSGGLGSRWEGEAFGKDYELPNARAYTETCAAIGSVMWNWRLLQIAGEARYADLMEHTLYNAVLPGLSLNGQEYFYQNPLENDGTHRRQPWFGCACCPPNVARLLAQLPGYVYSVAEDSVYVHLYAEGAAQIQLEDGQIVALQTSTRYPWDGDIQIRVETEGSFALRLRIPAWVGAGATLTMNGGESVAVSPGSYAEVRRDWQSGDTIRLSLPMPVRYVEAHPYVHEDHGQVAVLCGPLLYCLEEADNPGIDPRDVILPANPNALAPAAERPDLPGIVPLRGPAHVLAPDAGWNSGTLLYRPVGPAPGTAPHPATVTLIPYYAWANRAPGRMQVWLRR